MKTKLFFYLLLFSLFFNLKVFAQKRTETNLNSNATNPGLFDNWGERIFTGGNMGLQFGTFTFIDISPLIGYRITDRFSSGIGITYRYMRQAYQTRVYQNSITGGRIFARYSVLNNLFLHNEYEILKSNWYLNQRLFSVKSLLTGVGYSQPIGERSAFTIMGLWNIYYKPIAIYNNPIIRVGFNVGF